jgi:hypothetical protein
MNIFLLSVATWFLLFVAAWVAMSAALLWGIGAFDGRLANRLADKYRRENPESKKEKWRRVKGI